MIKTYKIEINDDNFKDLVLKTRDDYVRFMYEIIKEDKTHLQKVIWTEEDRELILDIVAFREGKQLYIDFEFNYMEGYVLIKDYNGCDQSDKITKWIIEYLNIA